MKKISSKYTIVLIGILSLLLVNCSTSEPKCYVTYLKKGNRGLEKFIIYVQNEKNTDYFYGFEVAHELDSSQLKYSNQYRLQKASLYKLEDTLMQKTALNLLSYGESEFVYRSVNKIDFTGGFHGDEQLVAIDFFLDEKPLSDSDLSEDFMLKPCNSFSYKQKSTMHETAEAKNKVNLDHPVEAIHEKHTVFKSSGYQTSNKIIWQKEMKLKTVYASIASLSTDVAEYFGSDKTDITKLDRKGGYKMKELNDNAFLVNKTNAIKVSIHSYFDTYNDTSTQFIWDISQYNKYYRDMAYKKPITVKKDEVWNCNTKITFTKK